MLFSSISSRKFAPDQQVAAAPSAPYAQSGFFASRPAMVMAVLSFATFGLLLADRVAYAGKVGDFIAISLAMILNVITGFLGQLLLIMVSILISVAEYNRFVDSAAVANGWTIVRDITNMFFIVVLLILAFGTILGVQNYSYRNNNALVRLLIMAVVVNFSRTICGLLIDASQVMMLSFVYGFREAAGGNFADGLRITQVMQARNIPDPTTGDKPDAWNIAVAMLLAAVMVLISLGVVAVMTITLIVRIVYLWLLIVLSPLAFLMKAVPGGRAGNYYSKWWDMFTKQVIVGPVMAFFLWLSLISVAGGNINSQFPNHATGEEISGPISEAFQDTEIQSFLIAICLLMIGQKLAKEIAGDAVGTVKGVKDSAKKYGKTLAGVAGGGLGFASRTGDRLTGGAVTKAREGALTAATNLPLVRGFAADALIRSRGARQKQADEESKRMKALPADVRQNFASAIAYTPEQKIRKKEALRAVMDDVSKKPPTNAEGIQKFYDQRRQFQALGKDLKDKSVDEKIKEVERARPSLIIDSSEKDPAERKRQEESFQKSARGASAYKIAEMEDSELTPQFLAFAGAKAVFEAQKRASGAQLEKLLAMGESEQAITAKQNELRAQPENFRLNSESQRAKVLSDMASQPGGDQKVRDLVNSDNVAPAHLTGTVLSELAKAGKAGLVADKAAPNLTEAQLTANPNLTSQIANGISAPVLAGLSGDVADMLRSKVAESNVEKALLGGASMGQTFKTDNEGNFANPTDRALFATDVTRAGTQGRRAELVGAIPTADLAKNGGNNDVNYSVINNVSIGDIKNMMMAGKESQVGQIMETALGLSKLKGTDQEAGALQQANPRGTMRTDEVKSTIANAKKLADEWKKSAGSMLSEKRVQDVIAKVEENRRKVEAKLSEKSEQMEKKLTRKGRRGPRGRNV